MNPNEAPQPIRDWLATKEDAVIHLDDGPLRQYQHGAITVRAASFSGEDIRYFFENTEVIARDNRVEKRVDPATGHTFIVSGSQRSFRQISAQPVKDQ